MTDNEKKLIEAELVDLRGELHDLKSCQVEFLKLAATTTAAIFGLWGAFAKQDSGGWTTSGLLALAPLMILLPTWWVFFDKASTITRIVGYKRILEEYCLGRCHLASFPGWENALRQFRLDELNEPDLAEDYLKTAGLIGTVQPDWRKFFDKRSRHRYWTICYCTFAGLSVSCLVFAVLARSSGALSFRDGWLLFAGALVAGSSWVNFRQMFQLMFGRNSYTYCELRWKKVLNATR
jgi:hypothetical protein